jgi:hypothetical protein
LKAPGLAANWGKAVSTTALARSTIADAPVAPGSAPTAPPVVLRVRRPRWLSTYTAVLVLADATAMGLATFVAQLSWFGHDPEPLFVRGHSVPYLALIAVTVPAWVVILALDGAYDVGPFGRSHAMWIPIVRAGAQLLAVIAVSYYIVHLALLGRGVLVALIPLAVALTVAGHVAANACLGLLRRRGRARRTAFVLGSRRGVEAFVEQVASRPGSGIRLVGKAVIDTPFANSRAWGSGANGKGTGAQTSGGDDYGNGATGSLTEANGTDGNGSDRNGAGSSDGNGFRGAAPWQPSPLVVHDTLARTGAETLVVTGGLAPGRLREVAWMLEGTGIDLLVMPTPAYTEDLRSAVRPVAGLPLLRLER